MNKLSILILLMNCVEIISKSVSRPSNNSQRHENALKKNTFLTREKVYDQFGIALEVNPNDNIVTIDKGSKFFSTHSYPAINGTPLKSSWSKYLTRDKTSSSSLLWEKQTLTSSDSRAFSHQTENVYRKQTVLSRNLINQRLTGFIESFSLNSNHPTIVTDSSNIFHSSMMEMQSIFSTKTHSLPTNIVSKSDMIGSPHLTTSATKMTSSITYQHAPGSYTTTKYNGMFSKTKHQGNIHISKYVKEQYMQYTNALPTIFKSRSTLESEFLLPSIIYSRTENKPMILSLPAVSSSSYINNSPSGATGTMVRKQFTPRGSKYTSVSWTQTTLTSSIMQTNHINIGTTSGIDSYLIASQVDVNTERVSPNGIGIIETNKYWATSTLLPILSIQEEVSKFNVHSDNKFQMASQILKISSSSLEGASTSVSGIRLTPLPSLSLPETIASESTSSQVEMISTTTTVKPTQNLSWQLSAICRYLCKQRSIPVPPTCGCTISPWDRK